MNNTAYSFTLQEAEDMLLEWLHTDEGEQTLKTELINMATIAASELKSVLYKHISHVIPSFTLDSIIIGEPQFTSDMKVLDISLYFDESKLHRESLYPKDKFENGIDNIILLMERGYHAKGLVHGTWHGHFTVSLKSRLPNDFMQLAIQDFNSNNTCEAIAELEKIYK